MLGRAVGLSSSKQWIWVCPFCYERNYFKVPIAATDEVDKKCTTVEYTQPPVPPQPQPPVRPQPQPPGLPQPQPPVLPQPQPPVFLFVLDTCVSQNELGFAKAALTYAIDNLPENALVGFISYGSDVQVYQLGNANFATRKVVVRRSVSELRDGSGPLVGSASWVSIFLSRASDCKITFQRILDELCIDQSRCTREALNVAAGLLWECVPGSGARIVSLVGGPCTERPGEAAQDYKNFSKYLVIQGHVLDLFALDTVVVAELKVAIENTGGIVVLAKSFGENEFTHSFARFFDQGKIGLAFNGTLEITCSADLKIKGIIGPCTLLKTDNTLPFQQTTVWKLCGFDKSTCLTVLFDISSHENPPGNVNPKLYIQIRTSYQCMNGETKFRVTTLSRSWAFSTVRSKELREGFDQHTAAVVMARLIYYYKMEREEEFDASRWLRNKLVWLCSEFGDYINGDTNSFQLNPHFWLFPQFMFNLLRFQESIISPDKKALIQILLNRENVTNAALLIQPSLKAYSVDSICAPALNEASFSEDRILLLDSYFKVVIFCGTGIAQQNRDYPLLQAIDDVKKIQEERFPVPKGGECYQSDSKDKYLQALADLNPSVIAGVAAGMNIVDFQVFCEQLKKWAVWGQTWHQE